MKVSVPTYQQATQFARNCDDLARQAALTHTKDKMGSAFDPKSLATARHLADTYKMIVSAHVCAIGYDRNHCLPIM